MREARFYRRDAEIAEEALRRIMNLRLSYSWHSLRLSLRLCVSAVNSSSCVSEEALEELARAAADFAKRDIQGLLVEMSRGPALD